jgi:hypothetical protein
MESCAEKRRLYLFDPNINDLVCTEGGNSGEHCDVKVTAQPFSNVLNSFSSLDPTLDTGGDQ